MIAQFRRRVVGATQLVDLLNYRFQTVKITLSVVFVRIAGLNVSDGVAQSVNRQRVELLGGREERAPVLCRIGKRQQIVN